MKLKEIKYIGEEKIEIGDRVLIPIDGEMFYSEQISEEYEVIMAFKKISDGTLKQAYSEMAYKLNK